jgi:hypothetical protein
VPWIPVIALLVLKRRHTFGLYAFSAAGKAWYTNNFESEQPDPNSARAVVYEKPIDLISLISYFAGLTFQWFQQVPVSIHRRRQTDGSVGVNNDNPQRFISKRDFDQYDIRLKES